MNIAGIKLQMGGTAEVDNRPRAEREKDEAQDPAVVAAAVSPAETPETPQPQPEN